MTDILDRIDQAIGCHECHGPLGASPSDDFCSEWCQTAWRAGRVDPLASTESCGGLVIDIQMDLSGWVTAMERVRASMEGMFAQLSAMQYAWVDEIQVVDTSSEIRGTEPVLVAFDETHPFTRAMEARRNRNTGPTWTRRPPRTINARGAR